ncbi:unnamed protein product [Pedinophyceae sp. YPF-701]|nr:unnamed protein product [Pedinophyceae sp. YPF-701]
MCSSWISHLPGDFYAGRVAGLGMNSDELGRNRALTDWEVRDLNVDPRLPYEDGSMDAVVNAVSIDYLNKPLDIVKEVHRVLKPGGLAAFSFSNRCFPTKAVSIWTATSDVEHVWIVGSYFHYSVPGGFTAPKCDDITPRKNGLQALLSPGGDPMFVVYARKSEA